jgi:hypothetical protein
MFYKYLATFIVILNCGLDLARIYIMMNTLNINDPIMNSTCMRK